MDQKLSEIYFSKTPTAKELEQHTLRLQDGEILRTNGNVYVSYRHGVWWTQMEEGGTQFSRTPLAAAKKAVTLIRYTERGA